MLDQLFGRAGRPKPSSLGDTSGVGPSLELSKHVHRIDKGTATVDDVSFATKIAQHSDKNAIVPCRCMTYLASGSPQLFIRRKGLHHMRLVGAASVACEGPFIPHSWGVVGVSAPLRTLTIILPLECPVGAPDSNFLGHSITPAGLRSNAENMSALVNKPMPRDMTLIRALMGGIKCYRVYLAG